MVGACLFKSIPYVKHFVRASIFHELYYLQNDYPSSLLFLRCVSNIANQKDSFVVSYLKNSLGFSLETAIKLASSSRYLHFENPEKPDLVLKFFENHGFSKTQVSSIIKRSPQLLLSNPEKTLLPKFEFLYSKGVTKPDLIKFISSSPEILKNSLQNSIIPNFNYLKTLLGSDDKVLHAVIHSWGVWDRRFKSYAEPNIAVMREYGVPESNIISLVNWHPGLLATSCDRFREIAEEVKILCINPLNMQFVVAVRTKAGMSKSTWEKKLDVYRECGWSDKEILYAFAKHPYCMMYSQDKIMATMDFLLNRMGWESSMIARFPTLLSYSLEKRIIPRCLLFEALLSKGLIKNNISLTTLLISSEKMFLQRYVTCYEDDAPQLLKLYQESLDLAITEARVS